MLPQIYYLGLFFREYIMKIQIIVLLMVVSIFSFLLADSPDWQIISGTQYSMSVMSDIAFNEGFFDNSEGNIVAAFGPNGDSDCRSLGFWQLPNPPYHNGFWYFTIVGNEESTENLEINFKIYDSLSDNIYDVNETITFENNQIIGTPTDLFHLTTSIIQYGFVSGQVSLFSGEENLENVVISANSYSTNASDTGIYTLNLPMGNYSITASLDGYSSETIENVTVFSDQTTQNIDFVLYPENQAALLFPEVITTSPSSTFFLPIELINPDQLGIEGISITVDFDQTVLDINNAVLDDTVLENENYNIQINSSDEQISIWIYSTGDLFNGEGEVINLEVSINSEVESGTSSTIFLSEAQLNEIDVISNNCTIEVLEYFDLSGIIHYYTNELPIPNALIGLTGQSYNDCFTDSEGNYNLIDNPNGNYISIVSKQDDLGGLSSLDASRIARFGVGIYDFDCYEQIAADVTLNGQISATDASRVARYGTELINSLNGYDRNWVFITEEIDNCNDWPPISFVENNYYEPLEADLTDEDYIAIRLGDVTGNWSQDSPSNNRELSASLPDSIVEHNSHISIPLTISELVNLEGADIIINYNDSILQATGINIENTILENTNFASQCNINEDNKIIFWLFSQGDIVSGDGVLVNIEFDVIGNHSAMSELNFNQFDINEVDFLNNTSDGSITIEDTDYFDNNVSAIKNSLIGTFPNPFNPETKIVFSTKDLDFAEINIYNLKGQKIKTFALDNLTQGEHSVIWNGNDENSNSITSGIYFYELKTDQFRQSKKAVLLK